MFIYCLFILLIGSILFLIGSGFFPNFNLNFANKLILNSIAYECPLLHIFAILIVFEPVLASSHFWIWSIGGRFRLPLISWI